MKNENIINATVILVGIIIIGFFALTRMDQYLKNMAVADCAKMATYTIETTKMGAVGEQVNTKSVEPIKLSYKTCMADKGYKTQMGED